MSPTLDPAADGFDSGLDRGNASSEPVVISVDAMGGDRGPAAVVAGLAASAALIPDARFIVHGPEPELSRLIAKRRELAGRCTICHADGVVTMNDKPSQVMRNGQATSMWSAIESVRAREAAVAVSCGNTGALMAVSMIRLRKLPGINRPAIACLWPSRNPQGFNVMLDVGADIRADAPDLLQYATMGASYARNGLGIARPRVGLLNVGTEEHKGRAELKEAGDLLAANAAAGGFDYVGFVEGSDLPSDRVDVIVTDGFTGNVALKTAEGTARLLTHFLKQALLSSPRARLAGWLAAPALRRMANRTDPRQHDGAMFLGLNGVCVKSHGGTDAVGFASACGVAIELIADGVNEEIKRDFAYLRGGAGHPPERATG